MKEFDFVKLTLWITVALIATAGGLYFWFGYKIGLLNKDLKQIEGSYCRQIGSASRDITNLEKERQNDKLPTIDKEAGIATYFYEQAKQCGIDPAADYLFKPREAEHKKDRGYEDRKYSIDFKSDRIKTRQQLVGFIFNVENRSRRIKLATAKLSLEKPLLDLWKASLTFVQRDPVHGETTH